MRDGSAATLAEIIESQAGVRLHGDAELESGWGRPETVTVTREDWGDDAERVATIAAVREHMGAAAGPTAREIGAERVARRAQAVAYGVRPGDGNTETMRERPRGTRPTSPRDGLRPAEEPLAGSLGSWHA